MSSVTNFYNNNEMISIMPGKKDFISVRNDDGIKVKCQKRLVLCNLKVLHKIINSRYPEIKIGFIFCISASKALYFSWQIWYSYIL